MYNIQSTSTLEGIARKSDTKHYQENSLKYKQNAKIHGTVWNKLLKSLKWNLQIYQKSFVWAKTAN